MLNTTVPETSWHSPYGIIVQVIVWFVVIIVSLETIIGNAMVVIAYKIERNISKQVSNRYIVSLAISDLIIGIEGFPLFTVYVLNGERWPLGPIACETWLFLDYTLCLVSILTVLLITADRYLSVCHTAKYLKWQSPTKTQLLIILSWLIPAIIFGIMIYGWGAMTGGSERSWQGFSMTGTECSAPFLSNPYVNMGMYVAYYWTTLVAMLILYKGIHQAAKNLEKKAKAKERRHIALILSQRLGTQVGVSLMLQSRTNKETKSGEDERTQRDSGYQTTTTAGSANGTESEQNLSVIKEERSHMESVVRQESHDDFFPCPHPTAVNSRRESDIEKISLLSQSNGDNSPSRSKVKLPLRSVSSRCSITDDFASTGDPSASERMVDRSDSLRRLFNDDELSSILHFKGSLKNKSSNESDSHPVLVSQASRKFRKQSQKSRSSKWSEQATPRKIAHLKNISQIDRPVVMVEGEMTEEPFEEVKLQREERWVISMKRRIARAFERGKPSRMLDRSSSSESTSSSCEEGFTEHSPCGDRPRVLQVTVTEQEEADGRFNPEPSKSDTFLSASGVSRKISSISTSITREKIISSIFAPISVFNRGRKQTKAEKRAHKAFRTITFIVGCFAVLWSPYYIMATVYGFCKGECIPSFLYTLSYYMCYLNSSGNPFAYALANRQFRSAFLRMFKGNFNRIA